MASKTFELTKKLDHIAFIMDGNGRWAKARGLPRFLGHKKACEMLIGIYDACRARGIKVMSFFAFSTENWNRPQEEIDHLMDYLEEFFAREIDYLCQNESRIMVSGDLSKIRERTRKVCLDAIARTAGYSKNIMNICLNYGGRDDIVRAAKRMAKDYAEGKIGLDRFNEADFASYLYTSGLPDVDLLIRTSGEQRLSNFLLYQAAYAEFVFTPVKWPDFDSKALDDCLKEYCMRNRRYGGLING